MGRGELVCRSSLTLEQVEEEWLAAQHHLRPRTRQFYRTNLDRHINDYVAYRIGRPITARGLVAVRAQPAPQGAC